MKKIRVLALCLVLGSFVLAGCSDNSDPYVQKEYTADAWQMEGIHIDVRDRQIEVSMAQDDQIHIAYFENSKETYAIGVSDGNVLTMTSTDSKDWTDYNWKKTLCGESENMAADTGFTFGYPYPVHNKRRYLTSGDGGNRKYQYFLQRRGYYLWKFGCGKYPLPNG